MALLLKPGLLKKQKNKIYDFFKQVIDGIVKKYKIKKFWVTTATLSSAVLPELKIYGVKPLIFLEFFLEYTFLKTIDLRNVDIEDLFKQCNETIR